MKYYFLLQYKRLYRLIEENGINPYLVYVAVILLFVVLSEQLFEKTEYAGFIFLVMALGSINNLGSKSRNEFLKRCFFNWQYMRIRLIENLLIAMPFVLFFLYKKQCFNALAVVFIGAAMSFFNRLNHNGFQFQHLFIITHSNLPLGSEKHIGYSL